MIIIARHDTPNASYINHKARLLRQRDVEQNN